MNFHELGNSKAKEEIKEVEAKAKRTKRRGTELVEMSLNYEYKRAHSETKLLDLDIEFKENHSYCFLTGGDVDSLSFLKLIIRHKKQLDYVLFSTWCMAGEDILQFEKWLEDGVIKKLDAYLGEIFPSSYRMEWRKINEIFDKHKCGKIVVFRNHSKIFAGFADDFHFSIQSSANINTNPRTENHCIIINKESFEFYKGFFEKVQTIV